MASQPKNSAPRFPPRFWITHTYGGHRFVDQQPEHPLYVDSHATIEYLSLTEHEALIKEIRDELPCDDELYRRQAEEIAELRECLEIAMEYWKDRFQRTTALAADEDWQRCKAARGLA